MAHSRILNDLLGNVLGHDSHFSGTTEDDYGLQQGLQNGLQNGIHDSCFTAIQTRPHSSFYELQSASDSSFYGWQNGRYSFFEDESTSSSHRMPSRIGNFGHTTNSISSIGSTRSTRGRRTSVSFVAHQAPTRHVSSTFLWGFLGRLFSSSTQSTETTEVPASETESGTKKLDAPNPSSPVDEKPTKEQLLQNTIDEFTKELPPADKFHDPPKPSLSLKNDYGEPIPTYHKPKTYRLYDSSGGHGEYSAEYLKDVMPRLKYNFRISPTIISL